MNPPCPLCTAPPSMVEGPLGDGGYFCGVCAQVFHVDAEGRLVKTQETRRVSPYRQAMTRINNYPIWKPGGL